MDLINRVRVQIQAVDKKHILIRKEKIESFEETVENVQRELINNLSFLITLLDSVKGLKGTAKIYELFRERIEKYKTLEDMLADKDEKKKD